MAGVSDVREILSGDGEVGVEIVRNVRRWVDEKVVPTANALEHSGEFPAELHQDMIDLGIYSITFPDRLADDPDGRVEENDPESDAEDRVDFEETGFYDDRGHDDEEAADERLDHVPDGALQVEIAAVALDEDRV